MGSAEYLPVNATTFDEVTQYYTVRVTEMGAALVWLTHEPDGVYLATIEKDGKTYYSIFIPPHLRGKGLIKNYSHLPIITIKSCGIIDTLEHLGFDYTVVEGWFDSDDYEQLKKDFADCRTDDGEFLMWHVTKQCSDMAADPTISQQRIIDHLSKLNDTFVY